MTKMSKDKNVKQLYLYVNNLLGIDIAQRIRTTEYAEGRALFYALCIKYTNLSKKGMGNYVNKDHCAVIHALKHTINVLSDHRVIEAYAEFEDVNKSLGEDKRVFNMLSQLTAEQYEVAVSRIESMVGMIATQQFQKVEVKEMEDAIL